MAVSETGLGGQKKKPVEYLIKYHAADTGETQLISDEMQPADTNGHIGNGEQTAVIGQNSNNSDRENSTTEEDEEETRNSDGEILESENLR